MTILKETIKNMTLLRENYIKSAGTLQRAIVLLENSGSIHDTTQAIPNLEDAKTGQQEIPLENPGEPEFRRSGSLWKDCTSLIISNPKKHWTSYTLTSTLMEFGWVGSFKSLRGCVQGILKRIREGSKKSWQRKNIRWTQRPGKPGGICYVYTARKN